MQLCNAHLKKQKQLPDNVFGPIIMQIDAKQVAGDTFSLDENNAKCTLCLNI